MNELDSLKKFEKRASNDLVAIHQELQAIRQSISQLYAYDAANCKSDDFVIQIERINNMCYGVIEGLKGVNDALSAIRSSYTKLEHSLQASNQRMAELEEDYLPFKTSLLDGFGQLRKDLYDLSQEVNSSLKQLADSFNQQIKDLPKPEYLDLDEIRKKLLLLCQGALDDSRAAKNRTVTNQSRIHILEKQLLKLMDKEV